MNMNNRDEPAKSQNADAEKVFRTIVLALGSVPDMRCVRWTAMKIATDLNVHVGTRFLKYGITVKV